jgi:hypothetical protein
VPRKCVSSELRPNLNLFTPGESRQAFVAQGSGMNGRLLLTVHVKFFENGAISADSLTEYLSRNCALQQD